jgi:rhodanese-related sulfurtransferase
MKKRGTGQRFTPFGVTQLVLLAVLAVALWLAYLPWRWERTKEDLRHRYPAIGRIDVEALKIWYAKTDGPQPIILDVRPQPDYDYSHLPGARHMGLSDTPESLGFAGKTEELFVICDAVGADAFPVAASLVQRGYPRVQVLEGGVFDWANRGLPLAGTAGETGRVQPGNSKFAGLLKRRATAP